MKKKTAEEIRQTVFHYMDEIGMLPEGSRVQVALSGGADSVCLLKLICLLREERSLTLEAVHVHHGIRGAEAERDAAFCGQLCGELQVPLRIVYRNIPEEAAQKRETLEEAGRNARREIFLAYDGITALAHHRDDVAETVLLNAARGTGIRGLASLRPVTGSLIRPLLAVSRDEIRTYLREEHQTWCEDSTNAGTEAVRNRLRLHLIPAMEEEINAGSSRHLAALSARAGEIRDFLEAEAGKRAEIYLNISGETVSVSEDLLGEMPVMAAEILRLAVEKASGTGKDLEEIHVKLLRELLSGAGGRKLDLPYGLRAERQTGCVVICPRKNEDVRVENEEIPLIPGSRIRYGGYLISAEVTELFPDPVPENKYTKWLDYDKINTIPVLRHRRSGDLLVYGKDGEKKKLRRFFIDEKISAEIRDEVPLLAVGEQILWVIGMRLAEMCRITSETRRALIIRAEKLPDDGA
ncbi:MAG: tRNA lysidine(34) synthetase TilS [Lachnospiraceae bacterium]|nr:tRNA lysidine(34) synthetase TilS [Lachnospiraceae bacterium]